jgi:hypothetical protein
MFAKREKAVLVQEVKTEGSSLKARIEFGWNCGRPMPNHIYLTHRDAGERFANSTDNAESVREFQSGVVPTPRIKCPMRVKL